MDIFRPPKMDRSFIPHQLGLVKDQAKKLISGSPVVIPFHKMGSGAGDHIMLLKPQNARKLLTAYKKGKGIKLHLAPHEILHTIHYGNGFFDVAKKVYHGASNIISKALDNPLVKETAKSGVRYGADAVGAAVGSALGSPEAGLAVGSILGSAGSAAIDSKSVNAGKKKLYGDVRQKGEEIAIDAIESNIHKLPANLQPIAQEAIKQQTHSLAGFGIKNHHYTSRKGDKVHHIGGHYVYDQIAPYAGGKLKKGSPEAKAFMASIRSKKAGGKINIGNLFKKAAHYVIPAATASLGAAAGSTLGGPLGGIAGSAAGSYAGHEIDKKLGVGVRKRGRPRKIGGALASASVPYQQALRVNFDGLVLNNNIVDNKPIRDFKTNPKVRPSSTEMTMSPYQSINSPAMNPFIPTSYTQMGGTSNGYGGRGLFGSSGGGGLYGASGGRGLY